ncbi:MFS transporter [bacterium]|nr:MFS transporter [bacterium]
MTDPPRPRPLLRFYLFAFCLSMGNSIIGMYLSLYFASRGIPEDRIGGLLSVYYLALPMVVLVLGLLTDRMPCRPLILCGAALSVLYCVLLPRLSDVRALALVMAMAGVGWTLATLSGNVLLLKSLEREARGRRLSLWVGASLAGYSLGTAASAILVCQLRLPPEIIFHTALPFYALSFALALGLPHAPIERFPLAQYVRDVARLPVFCLALLTFTVGIHFGTEHYALVRFMDDTLSLAGYEIAAYFLVVSVAMPLASRWAGHAIDARRRLVPILVLAMMVSGLSLALVAGTTGLGGFFFVRLVHVAADGVLIFGTQMFVSMIFVAGRVGGNYGFNRTVNSLGSSAGAALTGWLVGAYGLSTPFWVAGVIQAAMAALLWALLSRRAHLTSEPAVSH